MRTALVLALVATCAASAPQAATSGRIPIRLQLVPGCEVRTGASADDHGVNARLDFGRSGPVWHEPLTAIAMTAGEGGSIVVSCSPGVGAFAVSIDGGLRGDRTLLRGGGSAGNDADVVAYALFGDPARTDEYPIDAPKAFTVPPDGTAVDVAVFGAIARHPTARNDGPFADTLLVTIDL